MLLDTHVLLWFMSTSRRLGTRARGSIRRATSVHASAASIWEIAIKSANGRLQVPGELMTQIEASGLQWLPVTPTHAWAVRSVAGLPQDDPFDRLLVAQAAAEQLTLVTADRAILGASLTPSVRVLDARL